MGIPVEIFTVPPPCICAICHDIIKAAVSFMECGHTFCDECAEDYLPSKSCPSCRKQVSCTVPNYVLRGVIGAMAVKCPNQCDDNDSNKRTKSNDGQAVPTSDGCEWVGKYEDLQDHEKICNFKMVTCEVEGCDHQCRRKDMASHLSGKGLIHHMNLMRQSMATNYEKKLSTTIAAYEKKLSTTTAEFEKKLEDSKQASTSVCNQKIGNLSKKLNAAQEEIKDLKKQDLELPDSDSQASTLSDDSGDTCEDGGVKIKVEHCGIAEINGTYKQCGIYNGLPLFYKCGQWNGDHVHLSIFWECGSWYIDRYDEDTDFYKVSTCDSPLPPNDGWEVIDKGVNPPPQITVLGNDAD